MHFLSALAEQMVTSAPRLAAYPGGSPPLLHIPVAPCNSAFISLRTVQVYQTLLGTTDVVCLCIKRKPAPFGYISGYTLPNRNLRMYWPK